jgi:endoglucanase
MIPSSLPPSPRPRPAIAARALRVAPAPAPAAPAQAPAPARPGLVDRWRKAWAPSWAGVPQWVHDLWVKSGGWSVAIQDRARGSFIGRKLLAGLGVAVAGVWAAIDALAGLRAAPTPPGLATDPLGPRLARFPSPLPWLSTAGNQIVDERGAAVRLRGFNLAGFEFQAEGSPVTKARLDQVVAMGANVLRLPINQRRALTDPAYVARLDAAARDANARGVYVLFDMHWLVDHQTALPDADTARMWRQLAHRWADQPGVLFDLHNEPGMVGWEANARWAEALIANIRSVHPRSLVFVEGTNKAQRVAGALDRPIRAANVVYEVHAYGPVQHGPGVGPAQWDRLFGKVAERLPVFVGELGGEPRELAAMTELLAYCDRKGLGWAAWHCADGDVFTADGGLSPMGRLAARSLTSSGPR